MWCINEAIKEASQFLRNLWKTSSIYMHYIRRAATWPPYDNNISVNLQAEILEKICVIIIITHIFSKISICKMTEMLLS